MLDLCKDVDEYSITNPLDAYLKFSATFINSRFEAFVETPYFKTVKYGRDERCLIGNVKYMRHNERELSAQEY